jgi:NAD(P)H dehydrogenase (quinone)
MLYHWGAIIVPPGYTDPRVFAAGGNPYGVSVTADGKPVPEEALAAVRHLTERVVITAEWLNAGRIVAARLWEELAAQGVHA